jgi:hypothetical protein
VHTVGGTIQESKGVRPKGIRFPELFPRRTYTTDVEAIVSDNTARYDVILGYDVMASARMAMSFDTHTIRGNDLSTAWKYPEFPKDKAPRECFSRYLKFFQDGNSSILLATCGSNLARVIAYSDNLMFHD